MSAEVKETTALRTEKLTARIGAIVHSVRLSGELDPATVEELRSALQDLPTHLG